MGNLNRVPAFAVLMVVLLRVAIGWQFLYEGLWKIDTLDTPRPWSAEGFLKNARGPFRDYFRSLTGDPDEFEWLDVDVVLARWDDWHERFLDHYPDLTEEQKEELDVLLNGEPVYAAVLEKMPEGVGISTSPESAIYFDPDRKRLYVDGEKHLTPRERDRFLARAPLIPNPSTPEEQQLNAERKAFREALQKVYIRQSQLSFKERLRASLAGDPDRAGVTNEEYAGTVDERWLGDIDKYRIKLRQYEERVKEADTEFEFEHLEKLASEIAALRSSLVGPVRALEDELKSEADALLTAEQRAVGPVPPADSQIGNVNKLTIFGLTVLGSLLIIGLFTRLAAIGAAVMLLSFYLVWPPWPGVPDAPGPEHAYLVNKNLIEAIALVAIAGMPTGQWFGLDRLVRWAVTAMRSRNKAAAH